jgi:class 3 adenylate cyclase
VRGMREVTAVPLFDADVVARRRTREDGRSARRPADRGVARAFVPFAGVKIADDDRVRELERADVEEMLTALEPSVRRATSRPEAHARVLTTVLFTDIVDSTERAAALGDRAWGRILNRHDEIARRSVERCDGRLIKGTGDGILALFDAPAHGINCARTLRVQLSHAGITIRAGVHTGEVEIRERDVAGIGVHIAARVTALAGAGELLVSRTVRDLVAGAGYEFVSRGAHALKGIPDLWELLAVR